MQLKFSLRSLFLLPVLLLIVLQLVIHVELPKKKWPDERWTMKLVDSDGTILSLQDEANTPAELELKPGRYVVRAVFPGILDCVVNLFALHNPNARVVFDVNTARDGPMMLVNDDSGKVVCSFIEGQCGAAVPPGHYSLVGLTGKQADELKDLWEANKSNEYHRRMEAIHVQNRMRSENLTE